MPAQPHDVRVTAALIPGAAWSRCMILKSPCVVFRHHGAGAAVKGTYAASGAVKGAFTAIGGARLQ